MAGTKFQARWLLRILGKAVSPPVHPGWSNFTCNRVLCHFSPHQNMKQVPGRTFTRLRRNILCARYHGKFAACLAPQPLLWDAEAIGSTPSSFSAASRPDFIIQTSFPFFIRAGDFWWGGGTDGRMLYTIRVEPSISGTPDLRRSIPHPNLTFGNIYTSCFEIIVHYVYAIVAACGSDTPMSHI